MKRKRATSLTSSSSSSSSSQQQLISSPKSTIVVEVADIYLPDECWELVFKFLMHDEDNNDLISLSIVSKQFLSITNHLRLSLTIYELLPPFLPRFFQRFTNLISLNLRYCTDLDNLLYQISNYSLNLTSLVLYCSYKTTFPANGLRTFSQNITTLTSLTCSHICFLCSSDMFLIADCFPNLQLLHLKHCNDISEEGIAHVLRRCSNIRNLKLASCLGVKLRGMNFEVPKLEVLNLSYTKVDDETLYVIAKSCSGLSHLLLKACNYVTEKGVKHVVENCTQLREINLRRCITMHANVVVSMVFLRPSLRKITAPASYHFNDREMKLLRHQGCFVC